ncbi:kinase-like domain-containing protein [Ampelomyces quisqualis]|uniref:Kinase-like domain-containing protein n=1 Tax=Ampelomyces quisqualis TaxID=50730 RepID=A0A6A5QR43_AMPQU|nr:kinase-like domain-containing protein [Ampelomyces quisqualis]
MLRRVRRVLKTVLVVLPFCLLLGFLYNSRRAPEYAMPSSQSAEDVATTLLKRKGLRLLHVRTIQSLWAGYGQICHVTATVDTSDTGDQSLEKKSSYILKLITPPPTKVDDEGHTRKILSYQVEQHFYRYLAPQLPSSIPVAKCLGSINEHHSDGTSTTAMMLSDLKPKFPVAGEKRHVLSSLQVNATIDWLSSFHGFFWARVQDLTSSSLVRPPLEEVQLDGQDASDKSVWLNGGYTYLATRRKEYANLEADEDSEWSIALTNHIGAKRESIAEMVAAFLAPATTGSTPIERYQTLIHGDVKSENLFTSQSGDTVAFYDFQYTGIGLGVCDLAKLFTCSIPLSMLVADRTIPHELPMQDGEKALLKRYWNQLQDMGKRDYEWEVFVLHWEIALVDWLRFQASWGFWGNTEWLEARGRSILKDPLWTEALLNSSSTQA